jgi:hypothetical protein
MRLEDHPEFSRRVIGGFFWAVVRTAAYIGALVLIVRAL